VPLPRAALPLVAAGLLTAGCGNGQDRSVTPTPPPQTRQAVLSLLAALHDGHGARACALLTLELAVRLRKDVAGSYRATARSPAARLAQVRAAHARARTCPGAMELLGQELGPRRIARLTAQARSLPLTWLGPRPQDVLATLGDEDWDVTRDDDRWRVDMANALLDALP
jgi:hypothetical protein